MADEHDHDLEADVPMDDLETPSPIDTALSISTGDLKREVVPLLGGGVVLLSALRSLGRGQLRAIPKGIVGAGLLGYALRNRASSDSSTFEPTLDEIDGGTDGKEVSDQAHAAAKRLDSGRESQIDAGGEIDDSAQLGDERDSDERSRIEFTDDTEQAEPRSKPDVNGADDPRRDTDDESVEIDVSDSAMAEEVSEATGPDPEQAQPTQTDAIEPEESPDEDASDMKVEPDEDSETAAESRDESDDDGQ
ncbi:hypothetical protein [Natronorubrum sulfidifaciens]|uniref:Uncharacterized protein n=1 Tax=Natronorubrum sulfidifaciens JCM 14089 TaxID=1230460 RepID=L9W6R1_9EURY|nr:hypothetical protein [Natronorubrum sulfidifaciens]ELY45185.1 hypothetical protein C495_09590 [Natronorubrum sulfidifaciens JCM 14089]